MLVYRCVGSNSEETNTDITWIKKSSFGYKGNFRKYSYIDRKIKQNNNEYVNPSQKLDQAEYISLKNLSSVSFSQLCNQRLD